MAPICKICCAPTDAFAQAQVMHRYMAEYRRCTQCNFIFVDNPHWLAEAYEHSINETDIGLVWRAAINSLATKAIIETFFRRSNRYLDYGAGDGLFVRRMRDLGYDFLGYEPHGEMSFARDFALAEWEGRGFDLITAFEVAEHLEQPVEVFERMLSVTDTVLFSTEILPKSMPMPTTWCYYGLEHGQHISFFSRAALKALAARVGCHVVSQGSSLHLLSRERINRRAFRFVTGEKTSKLIDLMRPRPSLLPGDFERILSRVEARWQTHQ